MLMLIFSRLIYIWPSSLVEHTTGLTALLFSYVVYTNVLPVKWWIRYKKVYNHDEEGDYLVLSKV